MGLQLRGRGKRSSKRVTDNPGSARRSDAGDGTTGTLQSRGVIRPPVSASERTVVGSGGESPRRRQIRRRWSGQTSERKNPRPNPRRRARAHLSSIAREPQIRSRIGNRGGGEAPTAAEGGPPGDLGTGRKPGEGIAPHSSRTESLDAADDPPRGIGHYQKNPAEDDSFAASQAGDSIAGEGRGQRTGKRLAPPASSPLCSAPNAGRPGREVGARCPSTQRLFRIFK